MDEFEDILRMRWSYFQASDQTIVRRDGPDFSRAITELRHRCQKPMSRQEFAEHLMRIIALGIDGHASVSPLALPPGYTPFLIEPCEDRLVAFHPDRSGFLNDQNPFIEQIDGVPLDRWLRTAGELVPQGSPQFIRRHSLRYLRDINWVRSQLDLPRATQVNVRLVSRDRTSSRVINLDLAGRRPLYGQWPRLPSRQINTEIGYLRLEKMSSRSEAEIHRRMRQFRNTRGLIVDVRDNGGGTRGALRALFSYLMSPDDKPRIANVARYQLHPQRAADHLQSRFLYPTDSSHWNPIERRAILNFAETFRPHWEPTTLDFSEPHFMVLNRLDHPDIYHYDRSVVVLMNAKCFSATDVFLAGLKGWRNVTLMGTPSSGGSARSQRHKLPNSDIDVTVGSMVSWQVTGQLFDGLGVQPDVVVRPDPEYFIGGRDAALESAIEAIAAAK